MVVGVVVASASVMVSRVVLVTMSGLVDWVRGMVRVLVMKSVSVALCVEAVRQFWVERWDCRGDCLHQRRP